MAGPNAAPINHWHWDTNLSWCSFCFAGAGAGAAREPLELESARLLADGLARPGPIPDQLGSNY